MNISYSAAQDPFHSVFRMLCILMPENRKSFECERLYIYDFFACFPWLIEAIDGSRSVEGFTRYRNKISKVYKKSIYDVIPEKASMFRRMRPAQLAAVNSICSFGYIGKEEFIAGNSLRTSKKLPEMLDKKVSEFRAENSDLFCFFESALDNLPLQGVGGLKQKTGLDEYRYDYVPS